MTAIELVLAKIDKQYADVRREGYESDPDASVENPYLVNTPEHEAWRYGRWLRRQDDGT